MARHGDGVMAQADEGGAPGEGQALLHPTTVSRPQHEGEEALAAGLGKELGAQCRLAAPLAGGLVAGYALNAISLAVVGSYAGADALAAAAMGFAVYSLGGRTLLMGLCGALDTLGSQAVGAGHVGALPPLFQRAVLFLALHCLPLSALLLALPAGLARAGQPLGLAADVRTFLLGLLPALWVEAAGRPLNRILVAQSITQPQMWVGAGVAALHLPTCLLLVRWAPLGALGAALATSWSTALNNAALAACVAAMGLQDRVWGRPCREALQSWGQFARLAYPSAAMRSIESLSFSLCTVVAGLLPDPRNAVSAIGVAFNIYGILFMPFVGESIAASTRVGQHLGAGAPRAAARALLAAALLVPATWAAVAALLLAPPSQRVLVGAFVGRGADVALLRALRRLLLLVAALLALDGGQVVLAGVVGGAGRQKSGFYINLFAYWLAAVPLALLLAFAAGLGVEGLYSGMVLGPALQCAFYGWLLARTDWRAEARRAQARVLQMSALGPS